MTYTRITVTRLELSDFFKVKEVILVFRELNTITNNNFGDVITVFVSIQSSEVVIDLPCSSLVDLD